MEFMDQGIDLPFLQDLDHLKVRMAGVVHHWKAMDQKENQIQDVRNCAISAFFLVSEVFQRDAIYLPQWIINIRIKS